MPTGAPGHRGGGALLAAALLSLAGCATPPAPAPPPVPAAQQLQQHYPAPRAPARNDGVAALAYVLRQGQREVPMQELTARIREREEAGASHEEALLAVAAGYGLWAHASYGSLRQLADRVNTGVPVLTQILADPRYPKARRFPVVVAYDLEAHRLTLWDASGARTERLASEFWSQWLPLRCWMMTVCPPASATWNMGVLERMSRVRFFDQMAQRDQADAEAAQALLLEGQNTDLLVALAVRERGLGRAAQAEDLFRRALKVDPHHPRAANNLAFLLAEEQRDLDEAVSLARRALLLEPTNARVLDTLGYALFQQGRYEEAAATLERARQRARHQPPEVQHEIAFHLARAWLKAGQSGRARDVMRALLERQPGLLVPADLAVVTGNVAGELREPGRELDLDTGVR